MKKKLIFGLIFLLLAFGALEAQYHFFLRANRYWSNAGVFSTDNKIQSIGANNALRAAYSNSIYAEFTVDSDGALDLDSPMVLNYAPTGTSGYNLIEVDYDVEGIVTGSARGIYSHVTNRSDTAITGELTGGEFKVRSQDSDTTSVKGIHVSIDAKANTITTGRGIEISIDAGEAEHGGITTAQGLRVAHNSSGAHDTITGIVIEGPGTWTDGIDFAGTFDKPIDMSGLTCGSEMWTLFHGTVSAATAVKGIYLEITSTKTSSSTEGIRAEGIGNAASGTATIRGGNFKANILSGKKATMLEGVLAHASVAEGTITGITTIKGLGAFVSSGAGLNTTNLYGATVLVQTRGDETIGTNDVVIQLQNEAVGGNGRQMDSFIQFIGTNLSGGIKSATYLIDAGTVTDLVATAFMRLGDDEVMASVDHADKLNDISSTANDGWIKVYIGGEKKYIALYDEKTS